MTKKRKILLLSDDIRMHSGVATQSKEMVQATLKHYDWVQIAGAVKHPDAGKLIDMSNAWNNTLKIDDAYCKLYPTDGYGNQTMLREIIAIEKPDAILHFTDPRFWGWLYQMEHELRTELPIIYLNIWDDLPTPMYNENYYRSCDLLLGISKQTYGINKRILTDYEDWQVKYLPHGINEKTTFKIEDTGEIPYMEFKSKFMLDKYKFRVLYVNRNVRRKQPGDFVLAFKHMFNKLTPEEQKECVLVWHAAVVDEAGTDVRAVVDTLAPEINVIYTHDISGPLNPVEMNYLYNACDVYMNLASNEGFGLCSCESLHAGTPIVVNVTGGLQDQCGFKKDGKYLTADDYIELESNHRGEYKEHGEWVKPVWPSNISCQGSPQTPYIFDDRCQYEDAGEALLEWYKAGPEERERCGDLGKEYVNDEKVMMGGNALKENYIDAFETLWKNWKPKEKYTMEVV